MSARDIYDNSGGALLMPGGNEILTAHQAQTKGEFCIVDGLLAPRAFSSYKYTTTVFDNRVNLIDVAQHSKGDSQSAQHTRTSVLKYAFAFCFQEHKVIIQKRC